MTLMHRVNAQIARLSIRLGSPPLPNRAASRMGLAQLAKADGVGFALAQAVEMRDRDLHEPLKARLSLLMGRSHNLRRVMPLGC